jgi:succinyl-CoA synthetase alpha subunit
MPQALAEACALARVLSGEVKPLVPWVGENYARKGRLMAAAALAAANEGRTDCLEALMALKTHEIEAVRTCAAWAAERLDGRA